MVGARGFEPPTPWSRTGVSENLKPCRCRTCKHRHPKILPLIGPQLVHKLFIRSIPKTESFPNYRNPKENSLGLSGLFCNLSVLLRTGLRTAAAACWFPSELRDYGSKPLRQRCTGPNLSFTIGFGTHSLWWAHILFARWTVCLVSRRFALRYWNEEPFRGGGRRCRIELCRPTSFQR